MLSKDAKEELKTRIKYDYDNNVNFKDLILKYNLTFKVLSNILEKIYPGTRERIEKDMIAKYKNGEKVGDIIKSYCATETSFFKIIKKNGVARRGVTGAAGHKRDKCEELIKNGVTRKELIKMGFTSGVYYRAKNKIASADSVNSSIDIDSSSGSENEIQLVNLIN